MPTLADIKQRFPETPPIATTSRLFFDGDHWQEGDGWISQGDFALPLQLANRAQTEIKKFFTSRNTVREIVNRFVATLIGKEPRWNLIYRTAADPDSPLFDEQRATLDLLESALTSLWDHADKAIMPTLTNAIVDALLGYHSFVCIQLPAALFDESGNLLEELTIDDAIRAIWLYHAPKNSITQQRNKRTLERESWRMLTTIDQDGKPREIAEYSTIKRYTKIDDQIVERYSGEPFTYIEQFQPDKDGELQSTSIAVLKLGGHLLSYPIDLNPIIDDTVLRLQRAMNTALTMMRHNAVGAGFTERMLLNAQGAGDWIPETEGTGVNQQTRYVFKPKPFHVGLGALNVVNGLPLFDDQGKLSGYTTPQMWTKEPTPADSFIAAADYYYVAMLQGVAQLHAVLNDSAGISNESRTTAMTDFLSMVERAATTIHGVLRWFLETSLYLVGYLTNQDFLDIRADVRLRLTLPPISSQMLEAIATLIEKGIISHELGLMQMTFIDDPDTELQRIAEERAAKQAQSQENLAQGLLSALAQSNSGSPIPTSSPFPQSVDQTLTNTEQNP